MLAVRSATCPVCHLTMDVISLQPPEGRAVTLDTCLKCGALWFDRGELDRGSKRAITRAHTNDEVEYLCPRCNVHLWAQTLGSNDYWASACIRCDGVFIDGESVDFALSLHPAAMRVLNAPRPGAPNTTRARPRPKLKREKVDYLKDINVETCSHCGERANDTRLVLSLRATGWVCLSCRTKLDLLQSDERHRAALGDVFSALFK